MSWLSKLFGGGGGSEDSATTASGTPEQYKGFTISATTMSAGSEYQLAGSIEKEIDGELKRHDFVRADRFSSKTEAHDLALSKARQIIDEQGDRLFT